MKDIQEEVSTYIFIIEEKLIECDMTHNFGFGFSTVF